MVKNISKNARLNVATQKFFCPCGGVVKMLMVFKNGKKKFVARCSGCRVEKRRPSDFI